MKFIWLPVFLLVLLLSFSKFILFLQSLVLSFYFVSFKACFVCNVITFSVRHIRNSFGDVMKSRRSKLCSMCSFFFQKCVLQFRMVISVLVNVLDEEILSKRYFCLSNSFSKVFLNSTFLLFFYISLLIILVFF